MLDKNADWAERDDAIMYLGDYKEAFVEDALVYIIIDEEEDHDFRSDACASLVSVWVNSDKYDLEKFSKIPLFYQKRIINYLGGERTDWASILKENLNELEPEEK